MLGVIGLFIYKLYKELKRRPPYVIQVEKKILWDGWDLRDACDDYFSSHGSPVEKSDAVNPSTISCFSSEIFSCLSVPCCRLTWSLSLNCFGPGSLDRSRACNQACSMP